MPQSLDRFEAVVYGKSFMVNWVDSIIEKIRSTGMVKLECMGFIFIPSQISVVKICANFYPSFSNITLSYIEFTQKNLRSQQNAT